MIVRMTDQREMIGNKQMLLLKIASAIGDFSTVMARSFSFG